VTRKRSKKNSDGYNVSVRGTKLLEMAQRKIQKNGREIKRGIEGKEM
jgi:hypothetical protein